METTKELEKWLQPLAGGGRLSVMCGAADADRLLDTARALCPALGVVLREDKLNERLTVRDYLAFFAELWGRRSEMDGALAAMRLEPLQDTPIRKLSPGQLRLVAFAREAMHDVPVLCLQDPLSGLDAGEADLLLGWLDSLPEEKGVLSLSLSSQAALRLPGEPWALDREGLRRLEPAGGAQPAMVVDKIPAKQGDSIFLFNPGDIDYAESADGKTALSVRQARYLCTLTLDELEAKLAGYGFYRCHRSYLVNMQKVHEVVKWTRNSYSLRLEEEAGEIPLSKGRVEEMRRLYGF